MPSQHLLGHYHHLTGINIFVGNLSLDTTEAELTQEFVPYGEILSTSLMNDKYIGSRQTRGYGFVTMAVRAQGEAAITGLNGKMWRNHTVNILEAMTLSSTKGPGDHSGKYRQRSADIS
jgi:RNA recognition motif-containing protein